MTCNHVSIGDDDDADDDGDADGDGDGDGNGVFMPLAKSCRSRFGISQ